jgi:hypothetical protein
VSVLDALRHPFEWFAVSIEDDDDELEIKRERESEA